MRVPNKIPYCLARMLAVAMLFTFTTSMVNAQWVPSDNIGTLTKVHPSIDLVDLMPANFNLRIAAWDWLDSNRIVFAHWDWSDGSIWVLEGMKGLDKSKVTFRKYYNGVILEPLGIKVVKGEVYVAHKWAITKLIDTNGDHIADSTKVLTTFSVSENVGGVGPAANTYTYDLQYKDGFFYVGTGFSGQGGGFQYPGEPWESVIAKINSTDGTKEFIASGLRNPDGLGWGPEGELFATINQGTWNPASKLVHVKKASFYGQQYTLDGKQIETPPAIYFPYIESAMSPTQPLLLSHGPYKGQFIIGDIFYGNIHRAALEKVEGDWQGALFHFSAGQSAGIHRLLQDSSGILYLGGLGATGNSTWIWNGHQFGMQAAVFNNKTAFEVLEVHSKANGFTLVFTEPFGPSALSVDNYQVETWYYKPTSAYGGPVIDSKSLKVSRATANATNTQVHLQIDGLEAGRVVRIRFHRNLVSQKGTPAFTGEFWYTLNKISKETEMFPTPVQGIKPDLESLTLNCKNNVLQIDFHHSETGTLQIVDLKGRIEYTSAVHGQLNTAIPLSGLKPGIFYVQFQNANRSLVRKFINVGR